MATNDGFLSIFKESKPILAMLHLAGESDGTMMERLKREVDLYVNGGVSAVIVENYFGTYDSMVEALEYITAQNLPIPFGINCLNIDHMGFELGRRFDAAFVQLDSVVGHVKKRDEPGFQAFMDLERSTFNGKVLGGVRFKYQPVLSENTVEEDLVISKDRCDAVVVTQDATGQETSMAKIEQFRNGLGDFPLIVGAGVTPENARKSFAIADGAIVGSYFKDTYMDTGDVCAEHIEALMKVVREIRAEQA